MAYTGRTLINGAARELNVLVAGEELAATDAEVFLDVLARIIDDWNAEREAIYATEFLQFMFTPNLNPHTIGPTGVWTVAQRPVTIEGATVILSTGPSGVNAPAIYMHDQSAGIPAFFQNLSTPNLTTSYPTDGYYDATWPNGSLYLYPVPATAYGCQIQVRAVLTPYTIDTAFSMPPGYRSALTLTLAEQTAGIFGRPMPETLMGRAAIARARIFGNNTGARQLVTQDAGMPRVRRGTRSNWNWLIGANNGRRW